jgi:hypothetical protein
VAAGPESCDFAFDQVRVAGEAEIVVASDLDVARARRTALQGMPALPKLDLAADVIIVDASAQEIRFGRSDALRLLLPLGDVQSVGYAKKHNRPPAIARPLLRKRKG